MKNKYVAAQQTGEKDYDSEFCGSIPLHQINLIQPHGVLLVLDKNLRIRQVSENCEALAGIGLDELLEQELASILPAEQVNDLRQKLDRQAGENNIPFALRLPNERTFTASIRSEADLILLELEPHHQQDEASFLSYIQQIKYITSRIKQASTIPGIAEVVANEFKRLTGFDRVLVYQFDPMWNGTVIGQAKTEDMSDLLGLRFPASDVPRQARELYFKNPYRLIPTRTYEPVKLQPMLNPITRRFTDLTYCNLRSVASVHLEYMGNMGIDASMSVPLIMNDQLWGLISCHHKTPIYPTYQTRTAMELLSSIAAVQFGAVQREQKATLQAHLRGLQSLLSEQLFNHDYFTEAILKGTPNMLELLSLDGAAIMYEGNIYTAGKTPPLTKLKELMSWVRRNSGNQTFVTNSLPSLYPLSEAYKDEVSGLLALPINAEQGEYILCFRGEVLQTVNWGGNPDNAIQMEADGRGYHPRNSFSLYQQTVLNTSLPWLPEEMEAAEALQSAVLAKIVREKL